VYQVVGTEQYGWDHNRAQPPADPTLYPSREAAEAAADDARRMDGHRCDKSCYAWRPLM
jgi:hypothetical protein